MMTEYKIYHITRKENLSSILICNGIFSINKIEQMKIQFKNSAYANIQDRRSRALVKTPDNGTLHDYVPFYFAPRSPMLYANFKKQVEIGINTQPDIIYLVASVQKIQEYKTKFAFTDGHAVMEITRFFTNLAELNMIDWSLMGSTYWHNTSDDCDRKRRRQAEFLIKDFFPFELVSEIVVFDKERKDFITPILSQHHNKSLASISIKRDWYF